MRRVSLQPGYVLHRRAYRETSFLVELFTPEYGRLTVAAKGVKKLKSTSQGILQPFTPLLVSWSGKGELMSLTQVDVRGEALALKGECLFAGFYLNELMMALLQKWDEHPRLYQVYEETIHALQISPLDQKVLRSFEKTLLEELGYGILPRDGSDAGGIDPDKYYRFVPEQGFVISELGEEVKAKHTVFSGKSLLAIASDDWAVEDSIRDAKRLTRFILSPLLGNRQIYSRKLFMHPEESKNDE